MLWGTIEEQRDVLEISLNQTLPCSEKKECRFQSLQKDKRVAELA